MKVLVVQNCCQHGDFGEVGWSLRRRYRAVFDVVRPQKRSLATISPDDAELFVLLGSPHGAYDTHINWIPEEIAFARRLIEHDRPLLGICFGSQVIATALGDVRPRQAALMQVGSQMMKRRSRSGVANGFAGMATLWTCPAALM